MMRWIDVVLLVFCLQVQAGDFTTHSSALMPAYVSLAHGDDSFKGRVLDESVAYEIKNFSFGGVTKIEGVRKLDDDSNTVLRLEVVKRIEVLDPNFESMSARHRTAPNFPLFVEAKVYFFSGNSETFLLPHNLTLCGEEIGSGAEKAWFVREVQAVDNLGRFEEAPETTKAPKIPREYMETIVQEEETPESMVSKIWDVTLGRIF